MCWTLPVFTSGAAEGAASAGAAIDAEKPVSFLFLGLPSIIVAVQFAGCKPPAGLAQYQNTVQSSVLTQSPVTR